MSVDPSIEHFAFSLFRKLWIRNGLPDYAATVPDYPVVPDSACPDDYCDTVFAFQCLGSSFFEELCKEDYNAFAHSRSDFYHYLSPTSSFKHNCGIHFGLATVSLAVVAAEMGLACARRDNDIFVLTCPLAFAMCFEEWFGRDLGLVGHRAFWAQLGLCGRAFSHVRQLAGIVGRSASSRRDLIYRLQLLSLELRGPDELKDFLNLAIYMGALMDNSKMATEVYSIKHAAAMYFSWYLHLVHLEDFVVYLAPLYAEDFVERHDYVREYVYGEIASLCCIEGEESRKDFFAIYEESVFGERDAIPPPQPGISSDSSSAHQELLDLDPECMVFREIQVDDRDNAACRPEEFTEIVSDTPSLYELYDLKPKGIKYRGSQDNCGLDATGHRPEGLSGNTSEGPSLDEIINLKPKDSKSRDPHDDYGLEAGDIKPTPEEHFGIMSADVQSNALMLESHSKVEEKTKEGYCGKSSRTLDIFYKLRNMTDSHVSVDDMSELPRSSSDSKLKDKEVAIDTSASKLKDQGISIGTTFELKDPGISDDVNRGNADVKNQGISSKLIDQEGVLDSDGSLELIDQGMSMDIDVSINKHQKVSLDFNDFDIRNQTILQDPSTSKFDDGMAPNSSISQNDAEGTNFELNSYKNITFPSEACLKSKRAVETDYLENSNFTASETRDQKIFADGSASEIKDEGVLSTIDYPVFQDDSGEALVDFETLNKNSSLSTSMDLDSDEETLFHDCQTSMIDIFSEQYLKLDKDEAAFGDYNTVKPNDSEVIDGNILKSEEVLKEPVSIDHSPIRDLHSIKPPEEAKIESSPESSSDSSADSVCTVVSLETYRLKMADRNGENQSESKSSSESQKEAANPPVESSTTKANQEVVESLEQEYESLDEKLNDFSKLISGLPGAIDEEDKSNKGGKKRKNIPLKKKSKRDTGGKETEEPTIVESGPQKPEIIESDEYQLILVMGVPFEKPIKRESGFMNRITIKSF